MLLPPISSNGKINQPSLQSVMTANSKTLTKSVPEETLQFDTSWLKDEALENIKDC